MLASIAGEKDAIISAFDTGNSHLEVIDCYCFDAFFSETS